MEEEKAMENKINEETIKPEKKLITEITIKPHKKSIGEMLKAKAKDLMACKGCKKREEAAHGAMQKAAVVAGTTAVGVGVGIVVGVGALAAAAVAEVAVPAILTFKALGVTGGALGFLKGARKNKNGAHELSKTAKNAGGAHELLKGAKRNTGAAHELLKDAKNRI